MCTRIHLISTNINKYTRYFPRNRAAEAADNSDCTQMIASLNLNQLFMINFVCVTPLIIHMIFLQSTRAAYIDKPTLHFLRNRAYIQSSINASDRTKNERAVKFVPALRNHSSLHNFTDHMLMELFQSTRRAYASIKRILLLQEELYQS